MASLINPVITPLENESLCSVPTEQEIWNVVRFIGPTKSLGPDGFSFLFYQKFWSIVKLDICSGSSIFFTSGFILKSLNHTNIVFIPK